LKFSTSLKKNHEFKRLYTKGKSASSHMAAVYFRKNRSSVNRLGITVSTKLGKAVKRNRIRRRFKEIYRLNEDKFLSGYDIIFVARTKSIYAGFHELEADLLSLCRRLGLCGDDK
jgi:ribonuclease P protein component